MLRGVPILATWNNKAATKTFHHEKHERHEKRSKSKNQSKVHLPGKSSVFSRILFLIYCYRHKLDLIFFVTFVYFVVNVFVFGCSSFPLVDGFSFLPECGKSFQAVLSWDGHPVCVRFYGQSGV